jgi:hypothetical protein
MGNGFNILRKLDNGEELQVAWRHNRPLAERLVHELMELWPAQYEIREARSNPVSDASYAPRENFGPN